MKPSPCRERPLGELIDTDLPAHERERLVRVDAVLRAAVGIRDPDEAATLLPRARLRDGAARTGRPTRDMNRIHHLAGRSGDCERTHASVSAALDSELSEFDSVRVREHVEHCASCRAFHADAERFATTLRSAPLAPLSRPLAVPSRRRVAFPLHERRTGEEAVRPSLSLVTTPAATTGSTRHMTDEQTHELKLSFAELALIYKSLQAAKTLGTLPPQDELLDDTIQLVDHALNSSI